MEEDCIVLSSEEEVEGKKEKDKVSQAWTGKLAKKKPVQKTIQAFFPPRAKAEDSAIAQVIGQCQKFLKPADAKIKQKLSKLLVREPGVFTKLNDFAEKLDDITAANVFTQIKRLVCEAKKLKDTAEVQAEEITGSGEVVVDTNGSGSVSDLERKLSKLEKVMERISKKIHELQEREVDFSDEENSAYILEDKLTVRFNKVYKMYCRLQGKSSSEKTKLTFEGSRYPQLNSAVQQFLRKNYTTPDFADMLKLVRSTNDRANLRLDEALVQITAQECFEKAVHLMRQLRISGLKEAVLGYVRHQPLEDPADIEVNVDLKSRLLENAALGEENMNEVFRKFVHKQELLKLEGEEYNSDEVDEEGEEQEEPVDQDHEEESTQGAVGSSTSREESTSQDIVNLSLDVMDVQNICEEAKDCEVELLEGAEDPEEGSSPDSDAVEEIQSVDILPSKRKVPGSVELEPSTKIRK